MAKRVSSMGSNELSSSRLPNQIHYPKSKSEVNNVRSFAPSGISGPGTLSGNYPLYNYISSRMKRPSRSKGK